MIVYPAIDLRGGRVVQLVGGDPEEERIRLSTAPADVAREWIAAGFRALHVVDLDGALESGGNAAAVRSILAAVDVPVQVGGGVRSAEQVAALLAAGAERVVVGTRAIEEPAWLEAVAGDHPGRLVVAADCRAREVVTRGWRSGSGQDVLALVEGLAGLPLAALLVTDVSREGRMGGIDAALFAELAARTPHPLIASGGIAGAGDLRALAGSGVAGVVVGMALYTGALDARAIAKEYTA